MNVASINKYTHFIKSYPLGHIDTKIYRMRDQVLTIETEYIGSEKTRKLYRLSDQFGKLLKYKYLMLENNKIRKVLRNTFN